MIAKTTEQSTPHTNLNRETTTTGNLKLWSNGLLVSGIILILLASCFAGCELKHYSHGWLFAYLYFFTIIAGSLFWTMIHHATHAAWTTLFRRQWENIAVLLAALPFLFLPMLLFAPEIYEWMQPLVAANDPGLHEKDGFLNIPFYSIRLLFYFIVLIALVRYYRDSSLQQDVDGSVVHSARMQARSYVCLALFGVTFTFSIFDWLMSIDYHWSSHMFGIQVFAGAATSSVALMILLTFAFQANGFFRGVNVEHYHLLGKLLFAFTCFWGWITFAQYMLTWYANIPEETVYFIHRNQGSWNFISYSIVTLNAIVPFLLLLSQAGKRSPWVLGFSAGSILLGHAVETYWYIMPHIDPAGWAPHWLDAVLWLAFALVLSGVYLKNVASAAIYPIKDPRLTEALECFN